MGNTCRWIRDANDLTRDQAAATVRISVSHLQRIERGISIPHKNSLEDISRGYRLDPAMITHLHDLAAPAVNLMPAAHLRAYVLADTALTLNLARFQARGILAAYTDPLWNVLARNDLFADVLTGIDNSGSVALWTFSEHSEAVLLDPLTEKAWTVAMLKGAMGRYRDTEQAQDLVRALAPIREVQRLWAASPTVSYGRDPRTMIQARDPTQNPAEYQLAVTETLPMQHIQLITAVPNPDPDPS
ncbi:helix-turn-helix domain-containing protein [Nocardia salmonicida]|uniref:helix-turn-helix domain-containing protein n=1 Tax=Nocardia salmonicida TaxID=53431 RepID=UPI002E27AD67|nr:helix-turn-helix domain-containing protein [Nocardia salmonicida]